MRFRILSPAAGLLLGTVGAWYFLQHGDLVAEWLPTPLVSGTYNSILLVVGGCFAVLLYRLLRRGDPPAPAAESELRLSSRDTVRLLAVVSASLVWVNGVDYLLKRAVEYEYRMVMPLFALEMEGNLPTLFSAALLLSFSLLLALVVRAKPEGEQGRLAWTGLAWLFAFLSLDEAAGLHERLVPLGKILLSGEGPFEREWIFVYGVLLIPIGLLLVPLLRRLPAVTRRTWIVAAAVFLAGAVGLEALTGWYGIREAGSTPVRAFLNIAKEALEMAGVLIFLYGLLDYIEREVGSLGVLPGGMRKRA